MDEGRRVHPASAYGSVGGEIGKFEMFFDPGGLDPDTGIGFTGRDLPVSVTTAFIEND